MDILGREPEDASGARRWTPRSLGAVGFGFMPMVIGVGLAADSADVPRPRGGLAKL
jgi:hypothetical protein